MNNPIAKTKIGYKVLPIVCWVFLAWVFINPAPAAAQLTGSGVGEGFISEEMASDLQSRGIEVNDKTVKKEVERVKKETKKSAMQRALDQIKSWSIEKTWKALIKSGDIAWRRALQHFLNTLAYDMATYIATGDKGQLPMFETKGWGGYLQDVADNTAGTFIEQLGKNTAIRFNLCNPSLNVMLRINLGLLRTRRPKPPSCTFSQLTKNWETALTQKDFLPKFQDMFNPWSNDLGIALTVQTGMESQVSRTINAATQARIEGGGWRPVRSAVEDRIETPADLVGEAARLPIKESTASEKIQTKSIIADSLDIFINTLIGKLITRWLTGGLVTKFPPLSNKLDNLANADAQNQTQGTAGARNRMKSLVEPNFKVRADYDILAELATCPDPNKAGPTDCVIDDRFRQAIEKKLTVRQALDQGYLNGNGIFGFTSDGLEPKFNEGYPYRSMIILRKYRIIPVGWEVAAQKIKDLQGLHCSIDGNSCATNADCSTLQTCVAIGGTKNLYNLADCFSDTDDYMDYYASWCKGLVDPDWVLKAPQNFCEKEGPGPEIISEQVIGDGSGSSLAVLRNDAYCADEQSCIKEKADGACELYGYCTEERRKWDFNAKGCEPLYNTCQTFGSADGGAVSYLENTLDFSECNLGNVGCRKYATTGSYDAASKTVTWDGNNQPTYLNKQAETCDAESQGCHQFIRLNPGGGANLLVNADFEETLTSGDWGGFGDLSDEPYQGSHSLKMNGLKTRGITVGAAGYNLAGESYALSFYAKGCAANDSFWLGEATKTLNLNADADWTRYNLNYTYSTAVVTNTVNFTINSSSCLIDNIKLERGSQATNFSDYASGPSLIHEKLLPSYLMSSCYTDRENGAILDYYKPVVNAPAACANFVRSCKKEEAGCELYTSVANETEIPAKVAADDYCPAACVGYNTFIQNQTIFDSSREAYFIPKTAKTCSAEAAGCDQFTNLDEVAKGGEGIEYYTYLRQCIKKSGAPTVGEGSCDEFYSWEGSDESGYQLKVESLKQAVDNNKVHPATTDGLAIECLYGLPPGDVGYEANKGCREFYSRGGQVSHYIFSKTIACTDDCHPYRRTEINVDENITTSGACTAPAVKGNWINNQCVVCKSGGVWNSDNNSCLYMAVPNQGTTCSAAQKNCREYTGNTGNNIRKIFTDDFSTGTTGAWVPLSGLTCRDVAGNAVACVQPSNQAITLGPDNKGHSIKVAKAAGNLAAARRRVGNAVSGGLSYVLNFVAKADNSTALFIGLANGAATSTFAASPSLTTSWQIFEINLAALDHEANSNEALILEAGADFYINNITLTEITDRYYLIKDSWRTPAVCDQTLDGAPSPLYMLGCDQYTDRAEKINNLKKFNKLCPESAVGCELMKDTHNSSNPYQAGTVLADDFAYVAYDSEKLCGASEKGCELLGQSYKYESATLFSDVYLKNDPDKYGTILCGESAVGCEAFSYDNGASASGEKYFKDPGDMVCEWRRQTGAGASEDWFKKKVKRCDASGNGGIERGEGGVCLKSADCGQIASPAVCAKDADCGAKNTCVNKKCYRSCLMDNNDYGCTTDIVSGAKTLGLGGRGNKVIQPTKDSQGVYWAGVCSAADSGCTEYIDPVSKFNTNLLFNGNFQRLASLPSDGWLPVSGGYSQEVTLDVRTVYRLARGGDSGSTAKLSCNENLLYILDSNNYLYLDSDPNTLDDEHNIFTPDDNSRLFYISATDKESYNCTVTVAVANAPGFVEIKKAAIDYQLSANLDRQSCNGRVNPGQGCVLFNERKQRGLHLAGLDWDADLVARRNSKEPLAGVPPANNDANMIIKVAPDRACDKWLACKSYIKDADGDNVCFDIGLCDAVDANGNCRNFLAREQKNQLVNILGAEKISNLSGYAKVGINGGTLINDYYPLDRMEQKGEVADFANGGFEYYGSNLYPIGWDWGGQTDQSWNATVFSVINNPISAQIEGIGRAPEGAAFLKLGSSFDAVSEKVDVIPGTEYIITAFVNTKNLKSGEAKIDISGITNGGGVIRQALGNDWKFQMGRFITGNATQISIKLYASLNGITLASSEGNFYFDDIKIRPALNSRTDWHTPQSCRLYPQSDALSCDYYEDSGKRQKGWPGYCLEYDRSPGDPNTCLLWYPVDKVKGDGIEEGAGYADRAPLYYCLEGRAEKVYEYRHAYLFVYQGSEGAPSCPDIDDYSPVRVACHGAGGNDPSNWICVPKKDKAIVLDDSTNNYEDYSSTGCSGQTLGDERKISYLSDSDGWYEVDLERENLLGASVGAVIDNANKYASYLCDSAIGQGANKSCGAIPGCKCVLTKELFRSKMFCTTVVQTVTPTGQNKFWSSRVYKGSDYEVPELGYEYGADAAPFGSMVPPYLTFNPYDWDGDANKDGIQPIPYTSAEGVARSGKGYSWIDVNTGDSKFVANDSSQDNFPYAYEKGPNPVSVTGKELIKRLFAQSYGVWVWDTSKSRYNEARGTSPNPNWTPPKDLCNNGTGVGQRPTVQPGDYCAILPTVTNIKVDGSVSDVVLTNSKFVKLSFNTKADSQQLPLVMYGVDWGDGTKTMVTGAEMFDKQAGSGLEEVIYHLYSYWDLKAKVNIGFNAINCLTPGECRVRPTIQIKDNWGWCNKGTDLNNAILKINVCTAKQWKPFTGWVVVKER